MRIIAGSARGRRLVSPPGERTRPLLDRVREALFSILGDRVEGARCLDLYAGTGSIGLEALSRGAAQAVFVERGAPAVEALRRNVEDLGFSESSRILRRKVEEHIEHEEGVFDLIFLDPPYAEVRSATRRRSVLALAARLRRERLAAEGCLVFHFPRDLLEGSELEAVGPADRRAWGTTEIAIFSGPEGEFDESEEEAS